MLSKTSNLVATFLYETLLIRLSNFFPPHSSKYRATRKEYKVKSWFMFGRQIFWWEEKTSPQSHYYEAKGLGSSCSLDVTSNNLGLSDSGRIYGSRAHIWVICFSWPGLFCGILPFKMADLPRAFWVFSWLAEPWAVILWHSLWYCVIQAVWSVPLDYSPTTWTDH